MIIITLLSCIVRHQPIRQNKNGHQARFPPVCLNLTNILNNLIVLFQVCFNGRLLFN